MLVEQALFTSAQTNRHQGYQIVARSPGIDDRLAQFLACWGPTHGALIRQDVQGDSCNYSVIDQDWVAVSRTFYGGPEYSGRGAMQVVTRFLVLRRGQLVGYENNPVMLARTALMLGHLWLVDDTRELPRIRVPESVPLVARANPRSAALDESLLQRSQQVLLSDRLALIAEQDPLAAIGKLIDRVPRRQRMDLSFSTGLWPSQHRLFRVHLLPELNAALHTRLAQQGIRFVAATV